MIRVVLVDDEALVRVGLRMILSTAASIEVVAEADDGAGAVPTVQAHRPDVLLMDIRMPQLDGLAATRAVLAEPNPPAVIILTTFDADDYVYRALEVGASGFLLKDTPPQDLIRAVEVVAEGAAMLSPAITRRLIDQFAHPVPARQRAAQLKIADLTERERHVVRGVAQGLANAEIGRQLFMSEATVKTHVSRLLTKLGLTNRVQVAILAHDAGLV